MGTGSLPGIKCDRGVLLITHPLLVSRSWKSRAISLPTLWAATGYVTGSRYLFLLQLSFYSTAVVLTLVQIKKIRINIHKRNNTKHSTNNTKCSTYNYTYYENTHTNIRRHITEYRILSKLKNLITGDLRISRIQSFFYNFSLQINYIPLGPT